ncbi:MAG TPA: polysaccharide pyruvyl transferase family protein [Sedimentisphaerales bacterium]|jgi:pyruvyltransferase|nr:polysaccharide pyruvyl transferase family protein [Sedimentisphaerales bacterium]HNU29614.1 polysaccharide pyruvyl transferase family protein [Sedimentisphaerales bacterium]
MTRLLKLYWSRSKPNFGDAMSPMVCERLAGCPVVYADRRHCDLVAQGSLLHRFREWFFHPPIHVWGTGYIEECRARRSRFHYHAVRGHLSARLIRGAMIDTFGDPGLLADVLWPELCRTPKRHKIGLVPHYSERTHPAVKQLMDLTDDSLMIDVFQDVTEVLRQVASCECVLSSSLHGLVVADAFGVPNAWLRLSGELRGNEFKFRDYYSVYGLDQTVRPLTAEEITLQRLARITDEYARPGLDQIKENLIRAFPFRP